jgi:hypothetical protein
MAITNDHQPEIPDVTEEDACPPSALQLRLAAGILEKLIERNGGSEVVNVFWDSDAFEPPEDQDEYVDPELWDPDSDEVLPEMEEIEWNIYECN